MLAKSDMRQSSLALSKLHLKSEFGLSFNNICIMNKECTEMQIDPKNAQAPCLWHLSDKLALVHSHTKPAPAELRARTGKEWETVKPLGEYFKRLGRVLLIDADAFKV